ncbi:translation initiation factor [Leptolyngbya sp. FACHB-261]|uniref:translation initiation factor n=1 Tax=Leptolyngbya sp. FACHB-261 TaxID=2692806 RepID=UPI001689FF11|nr:translation initiation factor [Leptolyngbya sp. FACHB-261]MBD2100217.1 translation initiation factor [Leptolyngbya sp. FACHB-261]
MARSDKRDQRNAAGERVVYSESNHYQNEAAQARPTPELPPNQQNLRIEASRKGRGGKTVTLVTGFVSKPETLEKLLKQLKAQCGTGGTLKQSEKGPELEIQGDHRPKVLQFLTAQGYKAKLSGG